MTDSSNTYDPEVDHERLQLVASEQGGPIEGSKSLRARYSPFKYSH